MLKKIDKYITIYIYIYEANFNRKKFSSNILLNLKLEKGNNKMKF